jgi:hypothetical protein
MLSVIIATAMGLGIQNPGDMSVRTEAHPGFTWFKVVDASGIRQNLVSHAKDLLD